MKWIVAALIVRKYTVLKCGKILYSKLPAWSTTYLLIHISIQEGTVIAAIGPYKF